MKLNLIVIAIAIFGISQNAMAYKSASCTSKSFTCALGQDYKSHWFQNAKDLKPRNDCTLNTDIWGGQSFNNTDKLKTPPCTLK